MPHLVQARRRVSRQNGKSSDGERLDDVMIFKFPRLKKAAIVKHAHGQRRSYSFLLQQMADEYIVKNKLPIPSEADAEEILGALVR